MDVNSGITEMDNFTEYEHVDAEQAESDHVDTERVELAVFILSELSFQ